MSWTYNGAIVEVLPDDCIGFVYLIVNTVTGRKYIGKKLAKFSKTSYKVVKQKKVRDWQDLFVKTKELIDQCIEDSGVKPRKSRSKR